jgi:hypothetical protein
VQLIRQKQPHFLPGPGLIGLVRILPDATGLSAGEQVEVVF